MFSKFESDGKLNPTFKEGPFELPVSCIRAYLKDPITPRLDSGSHFYIVSFKLEAVDFSSLIFWFVFELELVQHSSLIFRFCTNSTLLQVCTCEFCRCN